MIGNKNDSARACKDIEPQLVLYYYGDCEERERTGVEHHLQGCAACRRSLEELRRLLPLTKKADEPEPAFWDDYSREMRHKLADAEEMRSRWRGLLLDPVRPWPIRGLAVAFVLILAVTLTFTKGLWRSQTRPPEEQALLEIMPMAEDLEFFQAMEFLDAMELLETLGGPGNGAA